MKRVCENGTFRAIYFRACASHGRVQPHGEFYEALFRQGMSRMMDHVRQQVVLLSPRGPSVSGLSRPRLRIGELFCLEKTAVSPTHPFASTSPAVAASLGLLITHHHPFPSTHGPWLCVVHSLIGLLSSSCCAFEPTFIDDCWGDGARLAYLVHQISPYSYSPL